MKRKFLLFFESWTSISSMFQLPVLQLNPLTFGVSSGFGNPYPHPFFGVINTVVPHINKYVCQSNIKMCAILKNRQILVLTS